MKDILLERLSLYNFKNYSETLMEFQQRVICFVGDNGSGKTNLLDAIHYLSVCRSFFNPIDSQNILNGHEQGSITGEFQRGDFPEQIICGLRKGQRKVFKRNFKEYERLADHIGLIPTVIITPYDIELIWEGSEMRRKFMDFSISQQSKPYLESLVAYNHALTQRNALLKSFGQKGGYAPELLEPWDYLLAEHGHLIFEERKKFMAEYVPEFRTIYTSICQGLESPNIEYESELFQRSITELLQQNREKDRLLERTSSGIHKDELVFSINDLPIKKFASQGQQKSFLFALKFAQYLFLRQHQQFNPILLLDDLLDKMDERRMTQILHWLNENKIGQIFLTDTHIDRIPRLLSSLNIPCEVWNISSGKAQRLD